MSKKVYVTVETRLIIRCNDDTDVNGLLENMDYNFTSMSYDAEIETEIKGWEITDSK